MKKMTKAFEGIRIIDFSQVLAKPFAAGQLALLKTDVIKIEQPGKGDQMRSMMSNNNLTDLKLSPAFLNVNTNKRGITVDLKHPETKAIVHRLLAGADIIIENFKNGVIERLKYGYKAVHTMKPNIIYCSVSGYNQMKPITKKAAYDNAIQAASNMMNVTNTPDNRPLQMGYISVDIPTDLTTAFTIASALFRHGHTNIKQYLDVTMLDCAMTLLNPNITKYLITGLTTERINNTSPTNQNTNDT